MRIFASPEEAVRSIRAGEVVAVPTDTVMGLVGKPTPEVVEAIFRIKNRPREKPLILFTTAEHLPDILSEPSPCALSLARAFWPGPLTLVVPARGYPEGLLHQGTLGVRHPASPFPSELLTAFPQGLASTSANRSGEPPALKPEDLPQDLVERLGGVVPGRSPGGVPSTVLDCTGDPPRLLRPGPVGVFALEEALGREIRWAAGRPLRVLFVCTGNTCRSPMAHGLLAAWAKEKDLPLEVDSVGTAALEGAPVAREVISVLEERGISFSHRSRKLTPEWVDWADLVLAMTEEHRHAVEEMGGKGKTRRFAPFDMPDPIGQPISQYRWVADLLEKTFREHWFPYLERKFR